jgi:adenine-specific DNA-methyltransferase
VKPYYADEHVTLYHGRCEDVLPTLERGSAQVLLTDPPYFQVKDDDWDNQWAKADEFLTWLGGVMDTAAPLLAASVSVWMFASPRLTSRVEREVIAPRLRLLNSIRWVKEAGWHQKAEVEAQRRYLTAWEGVLLAEPFEDRYEIQSQALHKRTFAPLGQYIRQERERAGWSTNDLEVVLGYQERKRPQIGTRLCGRWEEGSALPTPEAYERMREVLNRDGGDHLRRPYEDLRRESEALRDAFEREREQLDGLRRPFQLRRGGPLTDIWDFPPVMGYPGKHPCEKPLSMIRHMIEATSRPGDLILDPFAGSGSTLRAAKDLGRRAIGIESDERWCKQAARRLGQEAFQLEWPA